MVLSVTLNPSVDHQIFLEQLKVRDTNRVKRTEIDAGGKGVNLSRVFAELGGETTATGFLGGGPGAHVESVLLKQGVRPDFVPTTGQTRTNVSVEDETDSPPTTFNESGPTISQHEYKALLAKVEELAPGADWLCMGGSLPPGVPVDAFREIAAIGRRAGCLVLLDADGEAAIQGLRAHPDFIKPNDKEAGRMLGREIRTEREAIDGAKELFELLAQGSASPVVALTRGADGAVLVSREGVLLGKSAPVEPKSTIGSGDSFLGGMLWALQQSKPILDAFRWGLAAGAATATTDGTEIARKGVCQLLYNHTEVRAVDC
jgi:1-phosphofructokinase